MTLAEITLPEELTGQLQRLAEETGKSAAELIVEAVEQLLQQHNQARRRAALQGIRGMWRDRTDLPDFEQMRAESTRFPDWGADREDADGTAN